VHKLEVKDLKKTIKKTEIIKGISLEVNSGEVVGLLGPNGAGKTTTFYMICGLISPTNGDVFLNDEKIFFVLVLIVEAKFGKRFCGELKFKGAKFNGGIKAA